MFFFIIIVSSLLIASTSSSYVATLYGAIQCEHYLLEINCADHNTEIYIKSANYGRYDQSICLHPTANRTLNCEAETSTDVVLSKCHGKESCEVWANNSVFGDPCVGTYKYLEVWYFCKDRTMTGIDYDTVEYNVVTKPVGLTKTTSTSPTTTTTTTVRPTNQWIITVCIAEGYIWDIRDEQSLVTFRFTDSKNGRHYVGLQSSNKGFFKLSQISNCNILVLNAIFDVLKSVSIQYNTMFDDLFVPWKIESLKIENKFSNLIYNWECGTKTTCWYDIPYVSKSFNF